jgi:hypothetical protein
MTTLTASKGSPALGALTIGFAVAFNIPYTLLAMQYDYPAILRRPPAEALDLFARSGPGLIIIWYSFALAALALVPLSLALGLTPKRLSASPALAIGAVMAGSLAGLTQAIGLTRWVFVVPELARNHAASGASEQMQTLTEHSFTLLNAYGGVAIGEHMGQLLTVLFVLCLSLMQGREGHPLTAIIGYITAAAITIGTGEGLALAMGTSGELFSLFTTLGFLGLTLWLIMTGMGLMRRNGPQNLPLP